eukprot:Gb_17350 [translate_table: standard]
MQPIMAIETPGKCAVFSLISALISCRSNRVRPQDGHETYSVLVFRILHPCSKPNDVLRRKSKSWSAASNNSPSPRPSTSMAPTSLPAVMTKSSL